MQSPASQGAHEHTIRGQGAHHIVAGQGAGVVLQRVGLGAVHPAHDAEPGGGGLAELGRPAAGGEGRALVCKCPLIDNAFVCACVYRPQLNLRKRPATS